MHRATKSGPCDKDISDMIATIVMVYADKLHVVLYNTQMQILKHKHDQFSIHCVLAECSTV